MPIARIHTAMLKLGTGSRPPSQRHPVPLLIPTFISPPLHDLRLLSRSVSQIENSQPLRKSRPRQTIYLFCVSFWTFLFRFSWKLVERWSQKFILSWVSSIFDRIYVRLYPLLLRYRECIRRTRGESRHTDEFFEYLADSTEPSLFVVEELMRGVSEYGMVERWVLHFLDFYFRPGNTWLTLLSLPQLPP